MSVTLRQCEGKENVWEVDIRILLPDGKKLRERRQAPVAGKAAALRWAQERERVLLKEGKPKTETAITKEVPTLKEFAPSANSRQLKPFDSPAAKPVRLAQGIRLASGDEACHERASRKRGESNGGGGSRTRKVRFL